MLPRSTGSWPWPRPCHSTRTAGQIGETTNKRTEGGARSTRRTMSWCRGENHELVPRGEPRTGAALTGPPKELHEENNKFIECTNPNRDLLDRIRLYCDLSRKNKDMRERDFFRFSWMIDLEPFLDLFKANLFSPPM